MKKIYFFCLFLFSLCNVCLSQSISVVEPELQQWLDSGSKEKVAVTIVLKSQAEASAVRAKAAAHRDRKLHRTTVVNEFKAHSKASQMSLLSFLQAEEKKGYVDNIASLWISNSIACNATREVICAVVSRSDIAFIGLDKELQILSNIDGVQQFATEARVGLTPHVIQVNASQVWEQGYTGKNVVVAILDSGINDEHYDLKDHLWQGYADTDGDGEADDLIHGWNYISNNANIKDDYGHGTHCAGIICADGTMGNIAGVAPDATLMTLKIVNRSGGGSPAQMIKGVQFAIENGANILSISLGFKSDQIDNAAKENLRRTFEAALEAGVIAFVAAGNDGENDKYVAPDNVDFPAACPPPYLHPDQKVNAGGLSSVVCVGSVNSNDEYSSISSKGPVTWKGTAWNDYLLDENQIGLIRPDICAPGEMVYSLKHDENDKYKLNTGTSQATPCVAGVAALMLEKNSSLTPADICRIMENTAKKLTETKSNLTGSGRVDALSAVNAVEAANEKPYIRVSSYTPKNLAQGNNRELRLVVTNEGKGASSAETTVEFVAEGNSIVVPEKTVLGSLASGESKEIISYIDISSDLVNGHTACLKTVISDGLYSWTDELELKINSRAKIIGSVNTPKVVAAGDKVALVVDVVNEGTVATVGETDLMIETTSSYVTFVKSKETLGTIAPGEKKSVTFVFDVSEDAPLSKNLQFDLFAVPGNYAVPEDLVYGFELHVDQYGYLEDGFEGWTTFDARGTKHPWWHSSLCVKHRMEKPGDNYSGKGHLISEASCAANTKENTTPIDNYLVSPKIKATTDSKFEFKARVQSNFVYYSHGEHFGVAVSESGNANTTSFQTIEEWTISHEDGYDWMNFSVDLSEYAGKEIYVAIRHFFTPEWWYDLWYGYDVYALHVDDAKFTNVIDMSTTFKYDNYSYFSVSVGAETDYAAIEQVNENEVLIQLYNGCIDVIGLSEGSVVSVYDISGRSVLSVVAEKDGNMRIDTETFGNGIYLVKVVYPNGVYSKSVVVQ